MFFQLNFIGWGSIRATLTCACSFTPLLFKSDLIFEVKFFHAVEVLETLSMGGSDGGAVLMYEGHQFDRYFVRYLLLFMYGMQ